MTANRASLLRERVGPQRVTHAELFFDLVYIFAVTQLSRSLLAQPTAAGALRTALLLTMVWLLWAYTTWVTNWLDPDRIAVRLLLLGLAAVSLVSSAALPTAFTTSGLIVGAAYLVMQVGRSAFTAWAITERALRRNFQRILAWCAVSGSLALAGGLASGTARALLWVGAAGVDLLGGAAGFYTPWLGRSKSSEWTIEGRHFAERCQGFILIAIGESIVVIGTKLATRLGPGPGLTGAELAAFVTALTGSIAFWWIYFDRSARDSAEVIATSADPGRLGRSAYHYIHPIMVAGIIVAAAGDAATADAVATSGLASAATARVAWLTLSGAGLFLAGHAAFKATVWRRISWPRVGAIAIIGLVGLAWLLGLHPPAVVLSALTTAAVIGVAVADQAIRPSPTAADPGGAS